MVMKMTAGFKSIDSQVSGPPNWHDSHILFTVPGGKGTYTAMLFLDEYMPSVHCLTLKIIRAWVFNE